jgi:hypothetical protein
MTQLHESTFEYLPVTDDQKASIQVCREAAAEYARTLSEIVPDGADKTYALRKLRDVAMWVNVAITRNADGSPRDGEGPAGPS